jgi:hypothetical protein
MQAHGSERRIGVDFDNNIVDYDHVLAMAAKREGLLPPGFSGGKPDVRSALRAMADGEQKWMRLQGKVYGALMSEARLIEGFDEFLGCCRAAPATVYIVSHKTEYGHFDEARVNLRNAARRWMTEQGFFDRLGLAPAHVFFEATRADKIARIKSLECSHFVDDLEEVFLEPEFPRGIERYLLSRGARELPHGPFLARRSWSEIRNAIFH